MEGNTIPTPIVLAGRLVAATREGTVWGIDAAKAERVWTRSLDEPIVWLDGSERQAFAIAESGRLAALDAEGAVLWRSEMTGPASSSPRIGRGILLATGTDGVLSAFSSADGSRAWTFAFRSGPVRVASFLESGIAVAGPEAGTAVLDDHGRLAKSGGTTADTLVSEGGRLIAGRDDGLLEALSPRSLRSRWKRRLGASLAAAPVVEGRRLFAVLRSGVLFALDARSGDVLWWRPLPSTRAFRPLLWGGALVVASSSRLVLAFDPKSGEPLGRFDADAEVRAQPVATGERLCLLVSDHWVFLSLPVDPSAAVPFQSRGDLP